MAGQSGVTTAVSVGALLILGFALYRYSSVIRKRKRKDDESIVEEPSIGIEKISSLSSSPLSENPNNSKNVSITISKNEQLVSESDKKDEARRIIQKVLSDDMVKKGVPESSKKILEDTLDSLDDRRSLRSTPTRSIVSEKSPEHSRYIPFEEVLKRSPTPTKGISSSPESLSPSKSYVHLSREPSFTRENKSPSPIKETSTASPSFELFKSKRTSVEKEVTEVFTSNASLRVSLSPEKLSEKEVKEVFASNVSPRASPEKTKLSSEDATPHIIDSGLSSPSNAASELITNEEPSILKENLPLNEDTSVSNDNYSAQEQNGIENEDNNSASKASPESDLRVSPSTEPNSIVSLGDGPSSFEIVDLKPRMFEEKKVVEVSKEEEDISETPIKEDVEKTTVAADPPPLETIASSKDERQALSTNLRPAWAMKTNGSGSDVPLSWEKGVAVPEKPKGTTEEDNDEMKLLSRSQEKDIPMSKALLSDSDEEEAKAIKESEEAMASTGRPLSMEDIKEESEEPEDTIPSEKESLPSQESKGGKSKKRNRKKN